ncbi:MAG: type 1 glutamine amidotransferase [Microthrixaceae bacterium]
MSSSRFATLSVVKALHVHHDANSSSGLIAELLAERQIDSVVHQVCLQSGSPSGSPVFPDPSQFDLIIVYGSRWSVYESAVEHWVTPELEFLRHADQLGVAVLGMCFGGQLLSVAHGGKVAPGLNPEIGWLSVEPTQTSVDTPAGQVAEDAPRPSPNPSPVIIDPGPWMQWHFDCFEVPSGAEALARSPIAPQAFLLRRNLAVQFHPEVNRAVLEEWFVDDLDQLTAVGVDPQSLLIEADRQALASRERTSRLLESFLALRSAKNKNVF